MQIFAIIYRNKSSEMFGEISVKLIPEICQSQ